MISCVSFLLLCCMCSRINFAIKVGIPPAAPTRHPRSADATTPQCRHGAHRMPSSRHIFRRSECCGLVPLLSFARMEVLRHASKRKPCRPPCAAISSHGLRVACCTLPPGAQMSARVRLLVCLCARAVTCVCVCLAAGHGPFRKGTESPRSRLDSKTTKSQGPSATRTAPPLCTAARDRMRLLRQL